MFLHPVQALPLVAGTSCCLRGIRNDFYSILRCGSRSREKQRGGVPAEMNRATVDLVGFSVTMPLRRNQNTEPRLNWEQKSLCLRQRHKRAF